MNVSFVSTNSNCLSSASNSKNYKQYPPEQALQKYMEDNNCDEATAKSALQQMYGAPTPPQGGASENNSGISGSDLNGSTNGIVAYNQGNNPKQDFDMQLIMLGIPEDIVQTHDQEQIKSYAEENNITLPDAPKQGQQLDFQG